MASVAGLRGTGDWGTSERPKNFREMILWRNPNGSAPLTALMSKMRSQTTDDPEFAWWEEELNPPRVKLSAQIVTAGLTATISEGDANDLVAGDLLLVEKATPTTYSFEIVSVTAVQSSTQFTVGRGASGTTANTATIVTSSYLVKIGNSFEEGTTSPDASTRNPTKESNYTQIFKHTYRLTGTAEQTNVRTGDPLKNDKKRRMFQHSTALEHAFLFGYPNEDTSGTKPKRTTGGLFYYLGKNFTATTKPTIATISSVLATTSEDSFLDAVYQVFDYNSDQAGDERLMLYGNGFANWLNKAARMGDSTRIQLDNPVKVYGMNLTQWVTPQGRFYGRSHPLMNINSRFTNGCFIIDPSGCRYRALRGRDTRFKDNVQANDADERKGLWITEAGVEYNHLRSMRYIAIE